ncbi:MAG: hypothetical protein IJV12_07255, partial [Acidaminococcaceae bacterium]|nr:hypothetical protein [Acidaminococcaceae bacterium]
PRNTRGQEGACESELYTDLSEAKALHRVRLPDGGYTREQALTSSFWEYLEGIAKKAASQEENIARLQRYIEELEKAIEGN